MTIGEFRTITKHMPDDTKLSFSYGDGAIYINTMLPMNGGLLLCEKVFGQTDSEGIANSMCLLSDKDKIKEENELIDSTKQLRIKIEECIDKLLEGRKTHDKEKEGMTYSEMESLMVATMQQLDCLIKKMES